MRFATFNVFSGRSPADGRFDVDRFAAAIASLDADVLALQEVDRDQPRSGRTDLTALAGEALGAPNRIFAPALYGTPGEHWHRAGDQPEDGPAYGCALISRIPLLESSVFRMPALPLAVPLPVRGRGVVLAREEPRVAIVAHLRIDSPDAQPTSVVCTHLPFVPGWNHLQLRRLAATLRHRPGRVLLLGDLNVAGRTPARLTGYLPLATAPTFPVTAPRRQIDHVLLRGNPASFGTVMATESPAMPVSDHRPLVVDVDLCPANP